MGISMILAKYKRSVPIVRRFVPGCRPDFLKGLSPVFAVFVPGFSLRFGDLVSVFTTARDGPGGE